MTEKETNKEDKFNNTYFEQLFREHFSKLCSFANHYLKDFNISKKIVHNVFVNIWDKRELINTSKPLNSYLYSSVRGRSLIYIRENKKYGTEIEVEILEFEDYSETSEIMIEANMKTRIRKAIGQLPEICRQIFELCRFKELKYADIAKKLNISEKIVETEMSKAMKILHDHLVK